MVTDEEIHLSFEMPFGILLAVRLMLNRNGLIAQGLDLFGSLETRITTDAIGYLSS